GVTKPMALWRCSSLYHATNRSTHAHAASIDSKGLRGYDGTYFNVRKSASEYGLSSLTLGRLNDGMMPSHCMVASIVAPFIGPPFSLVLEPRLLADVASPAQGVHQPRPLARRRE